MSNVIFKKLGSNPVISLLDCEVSLIYTRIGLFDYIKYFLLTFRDIALCTHCWTLGLHVTRSICSLLRSIWFWNIHVFMVWMSLSRHFQESIFNRWQKLVIWRLFENQGSSGAFVFDAPTTIQMRYSPTEAPCDECWLFLWTFYSLRFIFISTHSAFTYNWHWSYFFSSSGRHVIRIVIKILMDVPSE